MSKIIVIKTVGCELRSIDSLKRFQGNLKSISNDDLAKLKNNIVKNGFIRPIMLWNDNIVDGHSSLRAVKELLSDGYTLVDNSLPVMQVNADSEKQAAEYVLAYNSQFGDITKDGIKLYFDDFGLDIMELKNDIKLNVNLSVNQEQSKVEFVTKELRCPSCSYQGPKKEFKVNASAQG